MDQFDNNSYAIVQKSNGETTLNSASGQSLLFNIDNINKMKLASDYFNVDVSVSIGYDGSPDELLYVDGVARINFLSIDKNGGTAMNETGSNTKLYVDGDSLFNGSVTIESNLTVNGTLTGIPVATGSSVGGILTGFDEDTTNKNYPVELDSDKAYVHVPWTDNNTVYTLPNATESTLGGIIVGSNLDINSDGILSVNTTNFVILDSNNTFNGDISFNGLFNVNTNIELKSESSNNYIALEAGHNNNSCIFFTEALAEGKNLGFIMQYHGSDAIFRISSTSDNITSSDTYVDLADSDPDTDNRFIHALSIDRDTGSVGIKKDPDTNYSLDVDGSGQFSSDLLVNGLTIGNVHNTSGYAGIKYNGLDKDSYALLQSVDGNTYLNAASSQNIYFRIDNITQMTLNEDTLTVGDNIILGSSNSVSNYIVVGSKRLVSSNKDNQKNSCIFITEEGTSAKYGFMMQYDNSNTKFRICNMTEGSGTSNKISESYSDLAETIPEDYSGNGIINTAISIDRDTGRVGINMDPNTSGSGTSVSSTLQVSGNVYVGGDSVGIFINGVTVQTSDDRLKHNEKNINNGLEIIRKLEPQVYQKTRTMKNADFSGTLDIPYNIEAGVIAQDILKIDDISYSVIGGDYYDKSNNLVECEYGLNYNALFTYNIAATKELDKIVQTQQETIDNLKSEIESLKQLVNNLINN